MSFVLTSDPCLPLPQRVEAVIFDFDGTAIPNVQNGLPSDRIVEAVRQCRHELHLIGASGRPLTYAIPVIEALGLIDPVIVCGGTVIYDPLAHQIISRQTISRPAITAILDLLKPWPHPAGWDTPEGFIEAPAAQLKPRDDLDIIFAQFPNAPATHRLIAQMGQIHDVTVTIAPAWGGKDEVILNITPRSGTKEHAVATVLERLEVNRDHCVGVGDGHNDLHLFNAVGYKVAMGNAVRELQAAADAVTASVEDDGLAHVIEQCARARNAQPAQ